MNPLSICTVITHLMAGAAVGIGIAICWSTPNEVFVDAFKGIINSVK